MEETTAYGGALPHKTTSLCPECKRKIDAHVYAEDGSVWMKKTCPEHGEFKEKYWEDVEMYERARKHTAKIIPTKNPNVDSYGANCPFDCGLCTRHKSHTMLANIVVTNRCDLSCWYCFFYAKEGHPIYEPTLDQIRAMAENLREEKPVACNAIQLSLDAKERVLISKNGLLKSVPIGELVDSHMEKNKTDSLTEPIPHEVSGVNGLGVLSLDKNLKSKFAQISSVIRHKNNKKLYRIKTEGGWEITTTGSHSVFVLDDGELAEKAVDTLEKGDAMVGSLEVPKGKNIKSLDLLELIGEQFPDELGKVRICGFSGDDLKKYEATAQRRINWDSVDVQLYKKVGKGSHIRYFNSKKEKEIPINLEITAELFRLLGYYAGEGCQYKSGLVFTFGAKETRLIDDFKHCVKKVFGEVNIRERISHGSAIQLYIEGYLYKIFFDIMGAGRRSKEKQVPWLVFNAKEEFKKEFLKSYFDCDGNVKMRKTGYEIDHNTVSRDLASDLITLHLQMGIVPKVEESTSKPHLVKKTGQHISVSSKKYRVVLGGKENLSRSLWYLEGGTREKFEAYVRSKESHAAQYLRVPKTKSVIDLSKINANNPRIAYLLKRIRFDQSVSKGNLNEIVNYLRARGIAFKMNLNHLSESGIGIFRVKSIKRVRPSSGYVYDVSVPGSQAFFAGLGQLLAHNTGGEPTMRDDIVDIIRVCKESGVDHVQLNTDGINFAFKPDLVKQVREAGTNTVYMSFDGVTPKTNPKNHWEAPYAIDNCRKAGLGIVLVPTVIRGINDHELGDMINFGLNHEKVIRGVNFQPVSLVGRMPQKLREKQRITIPQAIKNIEEQSNGIIMRDDFYPVPTTDPVSRLVEAMKGSYTYNLSTHFACGMATYLIKGKDGKVVPLPQFVDVDGLLEYLNEKAAEIENGKNKHWVGLKIVKRLGSFIEKKKQPEGFSFNKLLFNVLVKRDYRSLGEIMNRSLFIGMMHFQDPYNYDVERVERCGIHYAMPDGRVVPFCAFNVIPEIYRDKVQAEYAIPHDEWVKRTGQTLEEAKYKRDAKKLEGGQVYKDAYKLKNYFKIPNGA